MTTDKNEDVQLNLVREVVRTLLRSLNTLRTYPTTNKMSVRAMDDLEAQINTALPLRLAFSAEGLFYGEKPLVATDDDQNSIVRALFRDGVRRLDLKAGMERLELDRFVLGLARPLDPEDPSEDYVTRLWEANLEHVNIAAVDPYLDLDLPDDLLEGKARPGGESEDLGLQPQKESSVPPPPLEAFSVNESERVEMQARVGAAIQSTRWESFVEGVFEVFQLPTGERRVDDLVLILESTFQRFLFEREWELALRIVKWLQTESPQYAREPLTKALTRMVDIERMRPLHQKLEEGSVEPEEAKQLLIALDELGAQIACAFVRESNNRQARRFYADVLLEIGSSSVSIVLQEFERGNQAVNMVLARVLGQLREKRSVGLLVNRLQDADVLARREWVRALAMIGGGDTLSALLPIALHDPDGTCRVLALRALSGERSSLDYSEILERIQSRSFAAIAGEEKDLIFAAFGATANDEALPLLEKMIKPTWLFRANRPGNEKRAVRALVRIGTRGARKILENYANNRNRNLSALCRDALKEFGDDIS